MSTKKQWKDDIVDVEKLELDLQNPRLPKHVRDQNDITQIRNYLLGKEDVLRIAKSIANNGYHRSAVAIACKENGKLIVLDGNRRLAACQLLLNPKLATNAKDKKELEELNKKIDKQRLKNIKITVAPSRKEAEKEIWDIHVNRLLKSWEQLQRLRMYKNLIDDKELNIESAAKEYGTTKGRFANELAKLYFYEWILELGDNTVEIKMRDAGFNAIERLIISKNGKKLLDYDVSNEGMVIFEDKKRSEKILKRLIPYIIGDEKIPAQATKDELTEKVFLKIDPKKFSVNKTKIKKAGNGKNKIKNIEKGSLAKIDWVMLDEYRSYKGAGRVKDILKELNKNKPIKDNNINILAVSLRVVTELAIYDKLKNKGEITKIVNAQKNHYKSQGKILAPNWSPGLKEMLKFMLDEANNIVTDPQDKKAINKIMQERKDFIDNLDFYIHNVSYSPTETKIREIWKTFCRPIFDIINKI